MTEKATEIGLTGSTLRQRHRPGRARAPDDRARPGRCWPGGSSRTFPSTSNTTREREFEYAGIKQPNRNPLLQAGVPGVDGMKTGFTDGAGYGLVATAKRDDRRVITVHGRPANRRASAAPRASGCWSTAFASSRNTACSSRASPSPRPTSGRASRPRCRWSSTETVAVTLSREARKGLVVKLRYASPVPRAGRRRPGAGPRRDHRPRHGAAERAAGRRQRRAARRHAGPGHRERSAT